MSLKRTQLRSEEGSGQVLTTAQADVFKTGNEDHRLPARREAWHFISPEFPPQSGGVGDYVHLLAQQLAAAGDEVHVWCSSRIAVPVPGVVTHTELGGINPADLRRMGRALNRFPKPRRLVLQWVPHAYGWRSMNVPFCLWMWLRSKLAGDDLGIMVHEPFLSFREGSLRQDAAALVHRLMTMVLLHAADRIWVSTPRWEQAWRPYAFGRRLAFSWLPLPSTVSMASDKTAISVIRRNFAPAGEKIVGHFGTFGYPILPMLQKIVPPLLEQEPNVVMLLIGPKGDEFRNWVLEKYPHWSRRLHATGAIPATDTRLSAHIAACDLMIQPYTDGASSRRTSLLAPLAHGVPIVTTSGPSTETLWEQSGAVTLVGIDKIADFVAQFRRLLSDSRARERMAEAARALYQNQFSIECIAELLRSAYPTTRKTIRAAI